MNFLNRAPRWAVLPERLRGMFNLNDPRWGRGEDNNTQGEGEQRPDSDRPVPPPSSQQPSQGRNNQAGQHRIWMNCGVTSTVSSRAGWVAATSHHAVVHRVAVSLLR